MKPNIQIPDEAYRTLCQRAADSDRLRAIIERPIDMVLQCPACGLQHIDRPDPHTAICMTPGGEGDEMCICPASHWKNDPHKTHLCRKEDGGCGHKWRPCASHPTNGVQAVAPGKTDSPLIPPLPADGLLVRVGSNREITASQHYKTGAIQVTTKLIVARGRR